MTDKQIEDIEGDAQVELSNGENVFAEYCLELIDEVAALKSMLAVAEARINKYVKEETKC